MLPFGHFAAGGLTAFAVAYTQPELTPGQTNALLLWGGFMGFAPDLDMVYAMKKNGTSKFKLEGDGIDHRELWPHWPIVWIAALFVLGLFTYSSAFWRDVFLLACICPLGHLLLDVLDYGVALFAPISMKFFAVNNPKVGVPLTEGKQGIAYWLDFLCQNHRHCRLTALMENALLIIGRVIVFYELSVQTSIVTAIIVFVMLAIPAAAFWIIIRRKFSSVPTFQ